MQHRTVRTQEIMATINKINCDNSSNSSFDSNSYTNNHNNSDNNVDSSSYSVSISNSLINNAVRTDSNSTIISDQNSLIYLKSEGFIMHLCCRDLVTAQQLLSLVIAKGFRESGISIGKNRIILAIRTTAFTIELPIAKGSNLIVTKEYLELIVMEMNSKLNINFNRIDELCYELKTIYLWPSFTLLSTSSVSNSTVNSTNTSVELSKLRRYGHSVVTDTDTIIVTGGYGMGINRTKSDRVSKDLTITTTGTVTIIVTNYSPLLFTITSY